MDTTDLLAERETTHGAFDEHAGVTQALKSVVQARDGWMRLDHQHKEAIEMILHKIGRILAGNPNYDDHWADIAGYAELGRRAGDPRPHRNGDEEEGGGRRATSDELVG